MSDHTALPPDQALALRALRAAMRDTGRPVDARALAARMTAIVKAERWSARRLCDAGISSLTTPGTATVLARRLVAAGLVTDGPDGFEVY